MAKDQELGINIKVKGSSQARREIGDVINSVDKETSGVGGGGRGKGGAKGLSGPPEGGGGIGVGGVAGGVAAGGLLLSALQKTLSSLERSVTQAFDPSKTDFEKQLDLRAGLLGAVPVVGGTAEAAFRAANQTQLARDQGIQGGLRGTFGAAARGIAIANPNATDDELEQLIKNELGPGMKELAKVFDATARGEQALNRTVAKEFGVSPEQIASLAESASLALEETKKLAEGIVKANSALDQLVDLGRVGVAAITGDKEMQRDLVQKYFPYPSFFGNSK